jgi:ACS family hexuronate transporter-like MFS transporter
MPTSASADGGFCKEGTIGRCRRHICALLLFATTINYIDRPVPVELAPNLQQLIGWNELPYGYIVTAFERGYALP